jgi:hypothetical protein
VGDLLEYTVMRSMACFSWSFKVTLNVLQTNALPFLAPCLPSGSRSLENQSLRAQLCSRCNPEASRPVWEVGPGHPPTLGKHLLGVTLISRESSLAAVPSMVGVDLLTDLQVEDLHPLQRLAHLLGLRHAVQVLILDPLV